MNSYLQRLLDRTAPSTQLGASVLPAGLSHSPVSLSDQRLNDPGFTDRYAPTADSREQFGELTVESPDSVSRHSPQQPDFDTLPSEAARIRVDSAPPQITMPTQELPTTEVAPPSLQHPRPTGHVDTADLILPESETVFEQDDAAPPPPLARRPETQTTPRETVELVELVEPVERSERPIPQPHQDSSLTNPALDITAVTPSPPRPVIEPPPQTSTVEIASPIEPINSSVEPETRKLVEVMPPPVDIPTLPDLPRPSPRQTESVSAPTPVVQAVPEPPQSALPKVSRSVRPMTAASASIIGELTPRRRALTLFGLRRR